MLNSKISLDDKEKDLTQRIESIVMKLDKFIKESSLRRRNNMSYKMQEALKVNYNDNIEYEKWLIKLNDCLKMINRDLSEYIKTLPINSGRDVAKIINLKTKITHILEP